VFLHVPDRRTLQRPLHTARERPTCDPRRVKIQAVGKERDLLPRRAQIAQGQDLLHVKGAITDHRIRIDGQPSTLGEHDVSWPEIAVEQHGIC
jgi:hypothetical protein